MRKVIQITTPEGEPLAGHIFEAPDEASLTASMVDLPEGCWHEVESEAALIIPPPPKMDCPDFITPMP